MATAIVLKDRNGKDVVYEGIETVTFDTPDEDVQATFTLGVEQTGTEVELALAEGDQIVQADNGHLLKELTIKKPAALLPENIRKGENIGGVVGEYFTPGTTKEIEPDFSEGNQTVTAERDERWNEVVVKKPETLLPENIAKGISIAGIIGTSAGSIKIKFGTFIGAGSPQTIEHNLGIIPDIFIVYASQYSSYAKQLLVCTGMSDAFFRKTGWDYAVVYGFGYNSDPYARCGYYASGGIDKLSSGTLFSADEETIGIGTTTVVPFAGRTYSWIAIGGLT